MANRLRLNLKEAKWALKPPAQQQFSKLGAAPESQSPTAGAAAAAAGSEADVLTALQQLDQHQSTEQHHRNTFTFIASYSALLRRAADSASISHGRLIHHHLTASGYSSNILLSELLILMYGKCRHLPEAQSVFDSMPRRSTYSWNLLLAAYLDNARPAQTLALFRAMDLPPDRFTFSTALTACSLLGPPALAHGRAIHSQMISSDRLVPDSVSYNSLITMYARCGSLSEAEAVFAALPDKTLVAWNCMMAALAQHGRSAQALELYARMDVPRNLISFSTALSACGDLGKQALETGKLIHAHLVDSKLQRNVIVDTALLTMYGSCGTAADAERVFGEMKVRNVVSWTVMVSVLTQNGRARDGVRLMREMELEGGARPNAGTLAAVMSACANLEDLRLGKVVHDRAVSDGFDSEPGVQNALINMYAKCGRLEEAKRVFDGIGVKSDFSWNAMIAAFVQKGCYREALEVYESRQAVNDAPNEFIFATVLGACLTLEEVSRIHARVTASVHRSDIVVQNSLIKMYAKVGSAELAKSVFDEMREKDEASWNGMIIAYLQHGYALEALELYESMKSEKSRPGCGYIRKRASLDCRSPTRSWGRCW